MPLPVHNMTPRPGPIYLGDKLHTDTEHMVLDIREACSLPNAQSVGLVPGSRPNFSR